MANKSAKEVSCPPPPRTTASIYCLVEPVRIHYLCCLLEAYEGLAISTTLDPQLGLLRLAVARGCEADLLAVLESEKGVLKLRAVNTTWPPARSTAAQAEMRSAEPVAATESCLDHENSKDILGAVSSRSSCSSWFIQDVGGKRGPTR